MENYLITELVAGDYVKYDYITAITGKRFVYEKDKDIFIRYGNTYTVNEEKDRFVITTPDVYPGKLISIPYEAKEYEMSIGNVYNRLLVFLEMPYNKEKNIELLKHVNAPDKCSVIMCRKMRNYGYTDDDTEESAIEYAKELVKPYCSNITVFDDTVTEIVPETYVKLEQSIRTKYKADLRKSLENLNNEFEDGFEGNFKYYVLDNIADIADDESKEALNFKNICGKSEYVGEALAIAYKPCIFDNLGEYMGMICNKYMKGLVPKAEIREIVDKICTETEKMYNLWKVNFGMQKNIPDNEQEFKRLEYAINFENKVNGFINNKLRHVCKSNISNKLKQLDKQLKKTK